MVEEFFRDPERYNHEDVGVIRVYDEDSNDLISLFSHDGAIHPPNIDEVIRFDTAVFDEPEEDEKDEEDENNPLSVDKGGTYRVIRITRTYTLIEWSEEDDDDVDQMYCTVNVYVEGPLDADV